MEYAPDRPDEDADGGDDERHEGEGEAQQPSQRPEPTEEAHHCPSNLLWLSAHRPLSLSLSHSPHSPFTSPLLLLLHPRRRHSDYSLGVLRESAAGETFPSPRISRSCRKITAEVVWFNSAPRKSTPTASKLT